MQYSTSMSHTIQYCTSFCRVYSTIVEWIFHYTFKGNCTSIFEVVQVITDWKLSAVGQALNWSNEKFWPLVQCYQRCAQTQGQGGWLNNILQLYTKIPDTSRNFQGKCPALPDIVIQAFVHAFGWWWTSNEHCIIFNPSPSIVKWWMPHSIPVKNQPAACKWICLLFRHRNFLCGVLHVSMTINGEWCKRVCRIYLVPRNWSINPVRCAHLGRAESLVGQVFQILMSGL